MLFRRLFICLLLTGRLYAADSISVKYLGIEQGLSNNVVTSIYRDHDGFMWFGTYDGLNRYDGYAFKVFRNIIGDSSSLCDNHVYHITGDVHHRLWICTVKGLSVYDPVRSKFISPKLITAAGQLQSIRETVPVVKEADGGKMILAGCITKGLLLFENANITGVQIPLPELKANRTTYTVSALEFDRFQKKVWVFIPQAGLCVYDIARRSLRLINSDIRTANCLKVDAKGNLWLGNDHGLFQYHAGSNRFSENRMPGKNRVTALLEDKQQLWVTSDGAGLFYLPDNEQKALPYVSKNGTAYVNSNAIYAIYKDESDRKWIGTLRGGVNLILHETTSFRNMVYTVPGQNNIVNNFILSFCEDANGNVWVGTDGAGLRYWDRRRNQYTQFMQNPAIAGSISSNFITNIVVDAQNDTWVSTWFGGINRLKKNTQQFEHFACYNPVSKSDENNVWLIYEDEQKKLWASTVNDGTLYYFNRLTSRFDLFDDKISNIQCLAEDKQGNFWGGSYNALIKIDRQQKKHQTYAIGYPVRCIREDRNQHFWIGTEGGGLLLFNREKGSFEQMTTADGLPSNTILRMLEDKKGNLWLSTYNGLCRFDPVKRTYRNFSQSDGLQSNQFSFNAGLALRSNEFLFGGIKGFNIFYPDSVYDRGKVPRMFLTGLKINNRPIEEDDSYVSKREMEKIREIVVPFDKAVASLDFIALEYTGADKIKYAYLLEGWDKGWNYTNNIRTVNYTRLQEGKYAFKLKVTNADGVWSEEKELLKIIVLPPWYRTWWAYLLYVITLAGAVYVYIVYNKRQERLRYQVKLAQLESEKEKELTEKRISFFTHISHEFRTPLTLIINPVNDMLKKEAHTGNKEELNAVYRNARRLLSLVDQLLLFRKTESETGKLQVSKLDLYDLVNDAFLYFKQQAKNRNIQYVFDAEKKELPLIADKEKLEIVFYNLLSNAFKYTPDKGTISMCIRELEGEVTVSITDSGRGIPEHIGNKIFDKFFQVNEKNRPAKSGFGIGLYLVRQLVEDHKGRIAFESKEEQGTTFIVTLPKAVEPLTGLDVKEPLAVKTENLLLEEIGAGSEPLAVAPKQKTDGLESVVSEKLSMLIVDDNVQMREYLVQIFANNFIVNECNSAEEGLRMAKEVSPDVIISDVVMEGMSGIEFCKVVKETPSLSHIPFILITGKFSSESRLKGIEAGADDYITKPFEKDILVARLQSLIKKQENLQKYFYNEITHQQNNLNISGEYKAFLEACIAAVEKNFDRDDFNIQALATEMGMSHSKLYKKIKTISGQSANAFIRFIRLRKAAELFINTDYNVNETAFYVGIKDIKYFREQFTKTFGIKPSEYIEKYRKNLGKNYKLNEKVKKD